MALTEKQKADLKKLAKEISEMNDKAKEIKKNS